MGQRENVRRVECQIHRAAGNMGLVRLFTRNAAVALESEPTPVSTAPSTTPPTADSIAQSAAEPTAETESSSAVPIYVIRTDGIAVDLVCQPYQPWESEHPPKHAAELVRALMRDEAFAGQLATEKPLRKFYIAICRSQGIKPFPWTSVLRHVTGMLKAIYGPAYKKTYKRVYEGGHLRNRRVFPLLEEAARARGQDVARVA